jgi:hypothetical protein
VLPGIAMTAREVWLNVHSDLQFAPRIRAVRAFLKNTLKRDPDMQATLVHDPEKCEAVFPATNAKRLRGDHAQTKT